MDDRQLALPGFFFSIFFLYIGNSTIYPIQDKVLDTPIGFDGLVQDRLEQADYGFGGIDRRPTHIF